MILECDLRPCSTVLGSRSERFEGDVIDRQDLDFPDVTAGHRDHAIAAKRTDPARAEF